MDDLKKELASLRLDDEPPRSRRRTWVASVLLVFIVAAGTIFWWGSAVDMMWPVLAPPATSGPGETMHRPGCDPRKAAQLRAHSLQSRLACRLRMSRQGLARARARKGDSDAVGERQGD